MSSETGPTIIVIVGISGDLSRRKLLPAIRQISRAEALPTQCRILGVTRQKLTLKDIFSASERKELHGKLELFRMDLSKADEYLKLKSRLGEIEESFGATTQKLFYLSIPPQAAQPVITLMGKTGLSKPADTTKLLVEKPFGSDLTSAKELIDDIRQHFEESQIYRIDHYLAKEMAQNIVVFRNGNALFKRTWNKDFIERIEITASEDIGIEGRGIFYEQTGALRDAMQSHLLQLAALTLMELPARGQWQTIPAKRLAALKQLNLSAAPTVRGQYTGYDREAGNPGSSVETFASVELCSSDPKWKGVPIRLTTGKSLKKKFTEIRLCYKREKSGEANELILHIQPNEGVELYLWAKRPGYEHELQKLPLEFAYRHHFGLLPEAYERVFVDAMRSDHSLFTTSEEVLESWRILEPVQQHWENHINDLIIYHKGSSPQSIIKHK